MTPERAGELAERAYIEQFTAIDQRFSIQDAILQACAEEREACANEKITCASKLTIYEAGEYEAWIDYSGGLPRILIRRMA